jgi:hypothetical protein
MGVSEIGLRNCYSESAHLIHFLIISDLHISQVYCQGCTYFGPSLPKEKSEAYTTHFPVRNRAEGYFLSLNNVISVHFTELHLL